MGADKGGDGRLYADTRALLAPLGYSDAPTPSLFVGFACCLGPLVSRFCLGRFRRGPSSARGYADAERAGPLASDPPGFAASGCN